jgi:hypothetical protein
LPLALRAGPPQLSVRRLFIVSGVIGDTGCTDGQFEFRPLGAESLHDHRGGAVKQTMGLVGRLDLNQRR